MSLQRVVALAELLVIQKAQADALAKELDAAKAALRRTETEDLPELMRELGLSSLTLDDGSIVSVVEEVSCSISVERASEAHRWLSTNGFGGLIKTAVLVEFGRDEFEKAVAFAEEVADYAPQVKEHVHPATLKTFIKEQMAKGVTIPFDLFGIHPYSKATIKRGSKR